MVSMRHGDARARCRSPVGFWIAAVRRFSVFVGESSAWCTSGRVSKGGKRRPGGMIGGGGLRRASFREVESGGDTAEKVHSTGFAHPVAAWGRRIADAYGVPVALHHFH